MYIGNLIGSLIYGFLYAAASTKFFTDAPDPVGAKVVAVGIAKVVPYMHAGVAGWWTALVKGVLCNWLVALASVFALVSRSTIGKIVAAWLPITAFVALGFEHSVANMFAIPARHDAGRADHRQPVADLERNPGHHRQHHRRRDLHRSGAVCDLQAGHLQVRRAPAGVAVAAE